MLKLQFEAKLDFQLEAIASIVDIFKGQGKKTFDFSNQVIPNKITLENDQILKNIQDVQEKNELRVIDALEYPESEDLKDALNLTIEMETGTGKTYVYTRAIMELYLNYGFTKFIIVVPSVAIKEGVLKSFDITRDHFQMLYEKTSYNYFVYSADKLERVRNFAVNNTIQIMIITRDAFNKKDINKIYELNDRLGSKPIDLIKKVNPIVILDEPQKIAGKSSLLGLAELNPAIILRFSATHKEIYNQIYRLSPYDAYNFGLVKKIEVASITTAGESTSRKIIVEQIGSDKNKIYANLKLFVKKNENCSFTGKKVYHGNDLEKVSNYSYYHGYIISEINVKEKFVAFSNGMKIFEGKSNVEEDEIIAMMVRETIEEHLFKKRKLNEIGIKVLSLFFIKRVADYLPEQGPLRKIFEEQFNRVINHPDYKDFKHLDVKKIQQGYFSEKRSDQGIENDEDAYNLIMKDKERLLSMTEPVEFIFSHSALREGWDNPNVFNICTLAYSSSEIKKRQEIGRGLRLAVNSEGKRIYDRQINLLTVVTNESYREFVEALQTEFNTDAGEECPPIEDKRERRELEIKADILDSSPFKGFWDLISKVSKFGVNPGKDELVKSCVKAISEIRLEKGDIIVEKSRLEKIEQEKIREEIIFHKNIESLERNLFNVAEEIAERTRLTRNTTCEILKGVKNLDLFFKMPQKYADAAVSVIKEQVKRLSINTLQYFSTDTRFDAGRFDKMIKSYAKYIIELESSKTLYKTKENGKDCVVIDIAPGEEGITHIEKEFALDLAKDPRVKLFFKFPDWLYIDTPAGRYIPDWGVVAETNNKENPLRNFIIETKSTNSLEKLTENERFKIISARKRFGNDSNVTFLGPVVKFKEFEAQLSSV